MLTAVCGLFSADSASATAIPWGSPTDTTSTSVYGLYNQDSAILIGAEDLIVQAGELPGGSVSSAEEPKFTTAFTVPSQLTTGNVPVVVTDFQGGANVPSLELAVCVVDTYPAAVPGSTQASALSACEAAGNSYLEAADTAFTTGSATSPGIEASVATAGLSWPQLSGLVSNLAALPGTLYSINGDVSIASTATTTAPRGAAAYSINISTTGSAGAGGYVLPSSFTVAFPNAITLSRKVAELPVSAEASPPRASAIGSFSARTPFSTALGGRAGTVAGKMFLIDANGVARRPDVELSFGRGVYLLGTLRVTPASRLILTFPELTTRTESEPLPISRITLRFAAKSSLLRARSCTKLGRVDGTATDDVADLAYQLGHDQTDGYPGNHAIALSSSATVVTNRCAPR